MDLNIRHKIIKLVEDNIGENVGDLWFANEFLEHWKKDPWKKKTDKQDFIKI